MDYTEKYEEDAVMLNLSEEAVVQTRLDKPDAYAFRLLIAMRVLCFFFVSLFYLFLKIMMKYQML